MTLNPLLEAFLRRTKKETRLHQLHPPWRRREPYDGLLANCGPNIDAAMAHDSPKMATGLTVLGLPIKQASLITVRSAMLG